MLSPRWNKLLGDARAERGRLSMMIAAIAVSLIAIVAVLGAWAVLRREMATNYLGTRPAAATLELEENVDRPLLESVRALPEVAEAAAREVVRARVQVGDDWRPMLLFVVDDFDDLRLNRFYRESGSWPPPTGNVLLERSALSMAKASTGSALRITGPSGTTIELVVSGIAHDPGLAPAWQERSVYAYATRATMGMLGSSGQLHELGVTFRQVPRGIHEVETAADELSRQLVRRGLHVSEIRVPPPDEHPHQRQMTTILALLLSFAALSLVLSSVLVANSLAAMLARQVREIGIMKTVGATTIQLAALYASLIAGVGAASIAIALPIGVLGARRFSVAVARMLNFNIVNPEIPYWVYAVQLSAGLLVPLAIASVPIARATRMSVRAAIDQHGAAPQGLSRLLLAFPVAMRNAMRRPSRFLLTVGLLSTAGALFMTSLAVSRAWLKNVDKIYENRLYDVEIRLQSTAPPMLLQQLSELPGIGTVEPWDYSTAAFARPNRVDLVHTYPDKGHGSLSLMAPPSETKLVSFPLLAGQWLKPGENDAVVLNHVAAAQRPAVKVGDTIAMSAAGRVGQFRLAGIVEEIGSPGVAYVSSRAFSRVTTPERRGRLLRLAKNGYVRRDSVGRDTIGRDSVGIVPAIEALLTREKIGVESVFPFAELRTAIGDHIVILTRALVALAAILAIVGILGLGSAIGISIVERTREIGVMKAVGATSRRIVSTIVAEAAVTVTVSYAVAILLSLPLTWMVEGIVGRIGFLAALPFVVSPGAIFGWAGLLAAATVAATLPPARRAAALSVQEALVVTG